MSRTFQTESNKEVLCAALAPLGGAWLGIVLIVAFRFPDGTAVGLSQAALIVGLARVRLTIDGELTRRIGGIVFASESDVDAVSNISGEQVRDSFVKYRFRARLVLGLFAASVVFVAVLYGLEGGLDSAVAVIGPTVLVAPAVVLASRHDNR